MAKRKYTPISLKEFISFMFDNYERVDTYDSSYSNEFIFDIHTSTPSVVVRVYSSILKNKGIARDVGEDAIRVVLFNTKIGRPIAPKQKRVHRMPNWRIHLKSRIDNLLNNYSKHVKFCPKCGAPVVVKTVRGGERKGTEFLACSAYPTCKYTESIKETPSTPTQNLKKEKHFVAELSDFDDNPICKFCGTYMSAGKSYKNSENEITHWNSVCKNCGATATIFND